MTYHNRENSVDFLHVVLVLVKNINRDTGLLAAKTADATRFESLHNGTGRINLSGRMYREWEIACVPLLSLVIASRRASAAPCDRASRVIPKSPQSAKLSSATQPPPAYNSASRFTVGVRANANLSRVLLLTQRDLWSTGIVLFDFLPADEKSPGRSSPLDS